MKKAILTIIFITLFINLSFAQETTVWLNGSKTDPAILKKKAQIEAKGLKVFINDASERAKRHSTKEISGGDEKFDRIFREGRELIDKEEWAKAAAKFNEIACNCPENNAVDAALYWLAFCYKKLKMNKETDEALTRLLTNYPSSSWADDARVLQYEAKYATGEWIRPATAPRVGRTSPPRPTTPRSVAGTTINADVATVEGVYFVSEQTTLEREDEIKLAAFQSLMVADPKKGIEIIGNQLKSNSKASETLKREMLRSLRNPRYFAFAWIENQSNNFPNLVSTAPAQASSSASETNAILQQNLALLRDTLVKGYQSDSNIKIRTEVIYALANINDEPSFNYIVQLYGSEDNKEIKKAVINSLATASYPLYGQLFGLSTTGSSASSSNKAQSEAALVSQTRKVKFEKLLEIVRTEKDLELKRLAFTNMQRFAGWSAKDGMVETISQIYDNETDEKFKISIIYSLVNIKQNQATAKLLDIAKNDKSDKLRLEAIHSLRGSNNPEVIKFLEDLFK